MRRRLLVAFLLAGSACAADPGASPPARPPHVLLVISDDHGWTDYGFMGHPEVRTPRLDRLAAESLVFPRGYVTSPLCSPSLASIITGLHPHQHKITSNDPPGSDDRARNPADRKAFLEGRERMARHLEAVSTLPRLLATRGYLSLQTGKWWQGDFRRGGFTQGMTRGQRHGDEGLDIGRRTLRPIYDFIAEARRQARPFFVWYAPMMPQDPHTPPDRLLTRYQNRAPSLHVARYWAMIEWFDETVGQLLDHLEREGLARDTLVVYVADNGWIQDPNLPRFAPRSKGTPYEGGVRTPILVRRPGRIEPRRVEIPVSGVDLAPTILKAAGVPIPAELPGVDLLDLEAVRRRPAVFGASYVHTAIDLDDPIRNLEWRWAVEDRWKLLAPAEPARRNELYDLEADPHETKDLADLHPERVRALRNRLDGWWNPGRWPRNRPRNHEALFFSGYLDILI